MLMHTHASARSIGQLGAAASRSSGARTLVNLSHHATIEVRAGASGSLGCQIRPGNSRAKWAQCSPLPLATSSTTPVTGKAFINTSAIASRRSEEHTSELQSLMRTSYAVFCLKKKIKQLKHKANQPTH